jgi:hypothetical protein
MDKKQQEMAAIAAVIAAVLVVLWVRRRSAGTPTALLGRIETHSPRTATTTDTSTDTYQPYVSDTAAKSIAIPYMYSESDTENGGNPMPTPKPVKAVIAFPRATYRWMRQRVFHSDPHYIENSAEGIHLAKARGYNGIDLDLGMTKDKVFVVNHDDQPFQHGAYDPTGKYKKGDPVHLSSLTWLEVERHVRYPGGRKIITAVEAARIGSRTGVYTDFEAKGDKRFEDPSNWARLYRNIHEAAPNWRGTVMALPHLTYQRGPIENQATYHSIQTLKAAGAAGFITGLISRGVPDVRYYTEAHISYVKNGPFREIYRKYGVRLLTGKDTRFYG